MLVFISHSHHDRDKALTLQKLLKKNKAETFLDQEEIYGGHYLPDEIRNGIKRCNIFLLIWSKYANTSEWVNKEWNTAYEMKKRIVPFLTDSLNNNPLPDLRTFVSLLNFVIKEKNESEECLTSAYPLVLYQQNNELQHGHYFIY